MEINVNREIQLEDFRLAVVEIWKNKLLILVVTIAGLFAGLFLTSLMSSESVYTASSSVYCATYDTTGGIGTTLNDTSVVTNYTDIVTSKKVCEYAASLVSELEYTAEDIQKMLMVTTNSSSYVITINVYNSSLDKAMKIANAVADSFVAEMSNITDTESVHVLDIADTGTEVESNTKNTLRFLAVAGAFAFAVLAIGIRSLLSDRIRSIAQCVEEQDEILGIVPKLD